MTKRELIDAFVRGDVDRRQFISRLTMFGVSGGAAVAYAATLGQSAAAGPAQPASAFVMRAQAADDEEYGTAIDLPSDEAGVEIAAAAVEEVLAILAALDGFTADDFEDDVFEVVTTILDQQREHAEALAGLLDAASSEAGGAQEFASAEEFLTELAAALDDLTAMYAAVVPALENGELRQTMMEIASVASRHAALVNHFAGLDAVPEAFQTAELPE